MERDWSGKLAVMIICLSTRRTINTGLTMTRFEFERALLGSRTIRCPHCGHIHVWSKKDAHLAGEQA